MSCGEHGRRITRITRTCSRSASHATTGRAVKRLQLARQRRGARNRQYARRRPQLSPLLSVTTQAATPRSRRGRSCALPPRVCSGKTSRSTRLSTSAKRRAARYSQQPLQNKMLHKRRSVCKVRNVRAYVCVWAGGRVRKILSLLIRYTRYCSLLYCHRIHRTVPDRVFYTTRVYCTVHPDVRYVNRKSPPELGRLAETSRPDFRVQREIEQSQRPPESGRLLRVSATLVVFSASGL